MAIGPEDYNEEIMEEPPELPQGAFLTNLFDKAKEAITSRSSGRVFYTPNTQEERTAMINFLGKDPGGDFVDVGGVKAHMYSPSDLPKDEAELMARRKPSEKDLSLFDEWKRVEADARKDIGIDPEEVHRTSRRDFKDAALSKFPLSSRSILSNKELAKIEEDSLKYADSRRDKAITEINNELTFVKSVWGKMIDKRESQKKEKLAQEKELASKAGQNWILPDRTTVISYDQGRSYVTSDGQPARMPPNAIKVPGGATLGELNLERAKKQAEADLGRKAVPSGRSPKESALEGTGPYGRLASAFEAVAGGLGMDKLVGQQGFFPEMADAKQYLRSVKQMGKAALMNSARGAIWEQQRIDELFPDPDKTFTNPRIEARKFKNLMDILSQEKTFNNQAIVESLTSKEADKYRTANNEIDRLLSLISEPKVGLMDQDRALIDKYLKRKNK